METAYPSTHDADRGGIQLVEFDRVDKTRLAWLQHAACTIFDATPLMYAAYPSFVKSLELVQKMRRTSRRDPFENRRSSRHPVCRIATDNPDDSCRVDHASAHRRRLIGLE